MNISILTGCQETLSTNQEWIWHSQLWGGQTPYGEPKGCPIIERSVIKVQWEVSGNGRHAAENRKEPVHAETEEVVELVQQALDQGLTPAEVRMIEGEVERTTQ